MARTAANDYRITNFWLMETTEEIVSALLQGYRVFVVPRDEADETISRLKVAGVK